MNPEPSASLDDDAIDQTAVARRIRDFCRPPGPSMASVSVKAGLSRSAVEKICKRLEGGEEEGDTGIQSLAGIARAMGVRLVWLLYGDNPPGRVLLRSFPEWPEAAREAVERLHADPAIVEAVGGWYFHAKPEEFDGIFVAGLARLWRPRS